MLAYSCFKLGAMSNLNDSNILRVQLVEDDPMWQEGVRQLLSTTDQVELVQVADNYMDGLSGYEAAKPDVVLVDWQLNGEQSGLDLANTLVSEHGHSAERIIVISGSNPAVFPQHPYRFIPKSVIASQLIDALQGIYLTA